MRVHTYCVDPADLPELISRRAALIDAVRAAHAGLVETRLSKLDDGTLTDTWRWESYEAMAAALPTAGSPEAAAAMSLTKNATAVTAEIIDER